MYQPKKKFRPRKEYNYKGKGKSVYIPLDAYYIKLKWCDLIYDTIDYSIPPIFK